MVAPPLNGADVAGTVDRAMQPPSPDGYVIGEQDVLTITVWKERELSGNVVVRPDGKITLPLVDEIQVVGLTPTQLRAVLVEKLKPFVTIPQLTVAVSQINSRKVYLIGEVGKTGTFQINSATTVLQILAQAGGVKDFAKRKDIYVLRNEQGKQVRHRFNYDEVIRGKKSEQNILLQPADTIVVP
jgi:polysaccharide export outer membrane protein